MIFFYLSGSFDEPYRKERTSHGGAILVYLNKDLVHSRITDLEAYCNFNLNIDADFNISKNVIILGNLNEDLLNDNFHNLKDTLVLNSMINVINSLTRQNALLDPILIPVDMVVNESGTIALPQEITDHSATYVSLPFFYEIQASFKRTIWLYS